jgi:hypothetical protein
VISDRDSKLRMIRHTYCSCYLNLPTDLFWKDWHCTGKSRSFVQLRCNVPRSLKPE